MTESLGTPASKSTGQSQTDASERDHGSNGGGHAAASAAWRWRTDTDLRLTKISEEFKPDTGFDRRAVIGKSFIEIAQEAAGDSPEISRKLSRHRATINGHKCFRGFVCPLNGLENRVRYIEISGEPVFGPRGKFLGYEGIGRDVTRRIAKEAAKTGSTIRVNRIIESLGDGFALWDEHDRLVLCNEAFRKNYLDMPALAKPGMPFSVLANATAKTIVELDSERFDDWLSARRRLHNEQTKWEFLREDGRWILVDERSTPDGYSVSLFTDISDIKEREIAAETDARRNAQLAMAVTTLDSGVFIINPNRPGNPIVFTNPAFRLPPGANGKDFAGRGLDTLLKRRTDRDAIAVLNKAIKEGKPAKITLKRLERDGTEKWQNWSLSPIIGKEGHVDYFLGVQTDVTREKEEEEALARRMRQQSIAAELGRKALSGVELDPLLASAVSMVAKALDVPLVSVREFSRNEKSLTLRAAFGWQKDLVKTSAIDTNDLLPDTSFLKSGEPAIFVPGTPKGRSKIAKSFREREVISGMSVRIAGRSRPFGVLDVHATEARTFSADEVNFLQSVAFVLGVAVERSRDIRDLKQSELRYDLAVRGSNDGLWDWDLESGEVYYSPRWFEMIGVTSKKFAKTIDAWKRRLHPEDAVNFEANLEDHLAGKTPYFVAECRLRHEDGKDHWVLVRGLAVRDKKGKPTRIAGSMSDISDNKRAEQRLLKDALHDALTSLPNRALFTDRLAQAIARAERHPNHLFAVLFLDFDRFKVVNDSLGHSFGDQILIEIGARLRECTREVDTVARLGGDEFAILLEDLDSEDTAKFVANRINDLLSEPFDLAGRQIVSNASIGIAFSSLGYKRPGDMIRDADIAMYQAKKRGRGRHVVFEKGMHLRAVTQMEMETDLREAIKANAFKIHYQPVISIKTGRLSGFEALIRWRHPKNGYVSPAEFIPIAEETGLIIPIGKIVLQSACAQMREWVKLYPRSNLSVSVNISPKQFADPRLLDDIESVIDETGLPGNRLNIEITEGAIMENPHEVAAKLGKLQRLGISLQVDDFGTGYSSLSHLHRFPLDALKVDRSFVIAMAESEDNLEIVRTIVALAHNLKLKTVAEGVETKHDLEQLKKLKCDFAQGYYFSKPMDVKAASAYLRKHFKKPAGKSK